MESSPAAFSSSHSTCFLPLNFLFLLFVIIVFIWDCTGLLTQGSARAWLQPFILPFYAILLFLIIF